MTKFKVGDKVSLKDDPKCIVYEVVELHYDILKYHLETDNSDGEAFIFVKFREQDKLYLNESYAQKSPKGNISIKAGEICIDNLPKKHDSGKPRMDLVRPEFTLALGEALGYGAAKYEEQRGDIPNYLKGEGFHYSKIIASLERHIAAFKSGIDTDEESGKSHLALATANLMFLHTYMLCDKGIDDRIKLGDLSSSEDEKRRNSERREVRTNTEVKE